MKAARRQRSSRPAPPSDLATLRARLAEAEETLRAIRSGEVDAVVVAGRNGPRVFTLEGAEHAYRVLIESMNEGAVTLTVDKMILYANQWFARMVKCPLEQVIGTSSRRFPRAMGHRNERREDSARCSARLPKKRSASRVICGPAFWPSWVWSPS